MRLRNLVEFDAYSFAVRGLVKSFSSFHASMKNNACVLLRID